MRKTPSVPNILEPGKSTWNPWNNQPISNKIIGALGIGGLSLFASQNYSNEYIVYAGAATAIGLVIWDAYLFRKKKKFFLLFKNEAKEKFLKQLSSSEIEKNTKSEIYEQFWRTQNIRDFSEEILKKSSAILYYTPNGFGYWKFQTRIPSDAHPLIRLFLVCLSSVSIAELEEANFSIDGHRLTFKSKIFRMDPKHSKTLDKERSFLGLLENADPTAEDTISFAPLTFWKRISLLFSTKEVPDVLEIVESIRIVKKENFDDELWIKEGVWFLSEGRGELRIEKNDFGWKVEFFKQNEEIVSIQFPHLIDLQNSLGHQIDRDKKILETL